MSHLPTSQQEEQQGQASSQSLQRHRTWVAAQQERDGSVGGSGHDQHHGPRQHRGCVGARELGSSEAHAGVQPPGDGMDGDTGDAPWCKQQQQQQQQRQQSWAEHGVNAQC